MENKIAKISYTGLTNSTPVSQEKKIRQIKILVAIASYNTVEPIFFSDIQILPSHLVQ
jgi:hypothetical protein